MKEETVSSSDSPQITKQEWVLLTRQLQSLNDFYQLVALSVIIDARLQQVQPAGLQITKPCSCRCHYKLHFKKTPEVAIQFLNFRNGIEKVKRFGFHAIRHLTASQLYKNGYSVGVIQTILRHKSPSTTERYLKSLGLENVRGALEGLSLSRGKVLKFKPKVI